MNISQAKEIPLTEIMAHIGIKPERRAGQEVLYRSPLRKEETASFSVNVAKNKWFDFGLDRGGDIIDFGKLYLRESRVPPVLRWIESLAGDTKPRKTTKKNLFDDPPATEEPEEPTFRLIEIRPLHRPDLIAYVNERGISTRVARHFVQEADYENTKTGKPYYGLAVPNVQGGYEIRNKYVKTSINPKSFSLIEGSRQKRIHIFEGMFDAMSGAMLSWFTASETVLILNSTLFSQQAADFLRRSDYGKVILYLDNDEAGRRATANIAGNVNRVPVENAAGRYKVFPDVNVFLNAEQKAEDERETAMALNMHS